MSRKRINRCVECKEPLKHLNNNQWMCDQSPSNCPLSIKVIYLNNPVGVGEHSDIMDAIEKEIEEMAKYNDHLEILDKYFKEWLTKT